MTELGKGYSVKNQKRMRRFYLFQKMSTLSTQLSWSHYSELLELSNYEEMEYYKYICEINNFSVRELRERIKSKEYERLDDKTKEKLKVKSGEIKYEIKDFIKHSVVIKHRFDVEEVSEKMLKQLILEDMDEFLIEYCSDERVYNTTYMLSEEEVKYMIS